MNFFLLLFMSTQNGCIFTDALHIPVSASAHINCLHSISRMNLLRYVSSLFKTILLLQSIKIILIVDLSISNYHNCENRVVRIQIRYTEDIFPVEKSRDQLFDTALEVRASFVLLSKENFSRIIYFIR